LTNRDRMVTMPPTARENALFDTRDPAAEAEADARADADVRNGRVIGQDAVKRWLTSLRSATPMPRPYISD